MQQQDGELDRIVNYYNTYDEQGRLDETFGQIEYVRTRDIIRRHLESPPAVVLDVGGAAGRYACWLAREGYQVHLVDPVPLHIAQARAASGAQPKAPIASCQLGDARQLPFDDLSADAVLLMGPLYHLVDAGNRERALREAYRVLKRAGLLFAVGISRFASTIDGLVSGYYRDPAFREIMQRDLTDGQHRNPTGNRSYFTDAFFHHPHQLGSEVEGVGFISQALVAIEGISYLMKDLHKNWHEKGYRDFIMAILRRTEREPTLMGASPHVMCVGAKP
jgi:ubiquinone/menaquinone biosynthesis C-methylase UbiE